MIKPGICDDCGGPAPYIMLHDEVWEAAGGGCRGSCPNFLCFSCIEKRLGRKLRRGDFPTQMPLNQMPQNRTLIESLEE